MYIHTMYIITNGLIDTDYGVQVGEESGCFVSGSFSVAQFCNSVACVHSRRETKVVCIVSSCYHLLHLNSPLESTDARDGSLGTRLK